MAILRFRVYWEEDESTYRDVAIRHTHTFHDLFNAILKSYEFDNRHKATFYRSNDNWQRGREITLEKYDKDYKAEPLLMHEVTIGSEIKNPNQKFLFEYDFNKNWHFMVELINVDKEESKKITYPACVRSEGIAPPQYGTKGIVDTRLAEMEEKYDLQPDALSDGFSQEGESDTEDADADSEEATDDTADAY